MTNFLSLGFSSIKSEKDFTRLAMSVIDNGKLVASINNGELDVYSQALGDSGIELWAVCRKKKIQCFNLTHVPKQPKKFVIGEVEQEECEYCKMLHGGVEGEQGTIGPQISFSPVNMSIYLSDLSKGSNLSISVGGVANSFSSSPRSEAKMFGCLMPTRDVRKDPSIPPNIFGVAGEIVDVKELRNPMTNEVFGTISLRQELAGTYEIAVPINRLKEKPKLGEIGFSQCYLEGKILSKL